MGGCKEDARAHGAGDGTQNLVLVVEVVRADDIAVDAAHDGGRLPLRIVAPPGATDEIMLGERLELGCGAHEMGVSEAGRRWRVRRAPNQ